MKTMTQFPKSLIRLANRAAKIQELECNEPGHEHEAEVAVFRFEVAAKKLGFIGVTWPGLYPVLIDNDGQWIHMPG
jgi:hypothetical protein